MTASSALHHDFKADVSPLSPKLRAARKSLQLLDALFPELSAKLMLSFFLKPRRKPDVNYMAQLPAGAQRIEVFHNLTKLTGWRWGEVGPAVLLVHGWESHTGRMMNLVTPLLEQGFRVVAFDAPGHGLSPSTATHLIDFAEAIRDVIEQQGPFYSIIAHSLGAAATAISLEQEPQLMPEKLVLLSPMADLQQHIDVFANVAGLSVGRKARLRALVSRGVGRPVEQCSTISAVRHLHISGLVVHDRDDTLIPYDTGCAIAENWHGAVLISTDHLGHRLGLNNREVINRILDYLTLQPESKELHIAFEDHRRPVEDIGPIIEWSVREA